MGLAALVIIAPLSSGAVVTALDSPPYLGELATRLANVTPGDLAALEWAASLPPCSNVLVAPGSAAQFLPAYAEVRVTYPMNPPPHSPAYREAVQNLSWGNYTTSVQADLLSLGVTEVFVTGQSTALWRAFEPAPFIAAGPEYFELLYSNGDAYVFEFVPGSAAVGCAG